MSNKVKKIEPSPEMLKAHPDRYVGGKYQGERTPDDVQTDHVQTAQRNADVDMYTAKAAQIEAEIAERQKVLADLRSRIQMLQTSGGPKPLFKSGKEGWPYNAPQPQAGGVYHDGALPVGSTAPPAPGTRR